MDAHSKLNGYRKLPTLKADNSNQRYYLQCVSTYAKALGASCFFIKKYNKGKCIKEDVDGSLALTSAAIGFIKVEDATSGSSSSSSSSSSSKSAKATPAPTVDFRHLDEFEQLIVDQEWVYIDPDTNPESRAQAKVRFTLFQSLIESTPHHQRQLVSCMPGNCYQFLTLVVVKVRVDGGSQYDNIKALSNIVFKDKSTIDDLLVDLWEVQQRARTMGDKTMDADMMRGTQDCTLDYEEVIAELRNLDGNRKPEKGHR